MSVISPPPVKTATEILSGGTDLANYLPTAYGYISSAPSGSTVSFTASYNVLNGSFSRTGTGQYSIVLNNNSLFKGVVVSTTQYNENGVCNLVSITTSGSNTTINLGSWGGGSSPTTQDKPFSFIAF